MLFDGCKLQKLIFLTTGVTFHTVLEIHNPFFQMFFTDLSFAVFMTTIAGIGCKTGGMTGGTGCSATMI
jgi:hypothetical protein